MISTFYSTNTLDTYMAFSTAILIGFCFGFVLERAGLASSRKLSSVFYLRDMTVVKIALTAILTCAFGLHFLMGMGWLETDVIYYVPTVYGAYIVGGLIFGVGFVMSGWCPGPAAAGLACGKIDALVFLFGAILGSSIFNDVFRFIKPLYDGANRGTVFVYDTLGISRAAFLMIFSVVVVACFWICEYIEKRNSNTGHYWRTPFLKILSILILLVSIAAFVVDSSEAFGTAVSETQTIDQMPVEKP